MTSSPLLTLADVTPSAAAAIGVPGFIDRMGIGEVRHAVVCLVDGLGWRSLNEHSQHAPFLHQLAGRPIAAAFPTTTPVGLASVGTGMLAGEHGMVGATFELPETQEILAPLQWGRDPNPIAVQPEATIFERVAAAGASVATLSPAAYAHSGLTRAVLRGADYRPVEDIPARARELEAILSRTGPTFTYVYWGPLDRLGHEFGVGSEEWITGLREVDVLIERLAGTLVPGSALVVTSDHGMVNSSEEHRMMIDDDIRLRTGVRRVAGEPRVRHVYARPGAAQDVLDTWRAVMGDRADVLTRAASVRSGLFGPTAEDLVDRIGDIVVIARGQWMMASSVDPRVSGLIGQHGGRTPEETVIPGLIIHG